MERVEINRGEPSETNVCTLTRKNMMHHEALFGSAYYSPDNSNNLDDNFGVFRIVGGITPSSTAKPKTCGLALALVAVFCYFPGISMLVSVTSTGFTNKSVIGIVFTTVAVGMTVASLVLCIRGHILTQRLNKKLRHAAEKAVILAKPQSFESSAKTDNDGLKQPRTSRDELILENDFPDDMEALLRRQPAKQIAPHLAKKIAQSFSLQRYFAHIDTVSGPFDLGQEEMDRLTERDIRGGPASFSQEVVAKVEKREEYTSSTDSAIYMDSETRSLEVAFFV